MPIQLDFIKQLTTTKAVKEEESIITKRKIRDTYNSLINSAFLFGKSRTDFEKLQDKIQLKFTFLCLLKILEDFNEDYEADKLDVRDKTRQIFESSEAYKEVLREKNRSKCSYINPYQNLLLGNSSNNIEITRGYERQLNVISKMLDLELTKTEIDPRTIIESYSTYLLQKQSFELLSDPLQKRKIDEEILLTFNPNQQNLYSRIGLDEVTYIPDKDENIYKMTNKYNDVILFQKIGTLGYEKFKSSSKWNSYRDNSTLQNYILKKEYISFNNDENEVIEKEYNIFTDLNISKLTSDPEFTALHADVLFSDLNLEEAKLHNGGYIGEIVKNENGKFDVYHYQDKLCACIEFQKQYGLNGY